MKVFGIAGYSGNGKTTLIERLIPALSAHGYTVSLVKHAHHDFDVDLPGKDSHRYRQAGASEVLVSSARRWALMHELRGAAELDLDAALARLSPCDIVLVEGYKVAPIPKLEVYRPAAGKPRLPADAHIVAVASDEAIDITLPLLDLNDAEAVARFILSYLRLANVERTEEKRA
ncbi:MAG: molybdopterin-guanine dinucleotide biosynthesis protein B [Pseudomonadota bacterium]